MTTTNTPEQYEDRAWYVGCWTDDEDGVTRYGEIAQWDAQTKQFWTEADRFNDRDRKSVV